ncbi:hypothetical protein [Jatrophihabitans endophyticus]|uniref:hypothetical protein n=1 Tax=Jatrophihabitans endophyticus TaxID=1206085 RepID=UPI0019E0B907|nr:hypothetical protein [Jatrophihabitans endophyticus]MBE7187601.1 hypothetical protein [Jatrophihabitans endophyticus]
MTASLSFGDATVTLDCGLWSRHLLGAGLELAGTRATLRVRMPFHPQHGARIAVDGPGIRLRERTTRRSSSGYQLDAFVDAGQGRQGSATTPER